MVNSTSSMTPNSMISLSHGIISGGTFTQHNITHNNHRVRKTGWELLQDAVAPGAFHNSGERFDPPRCHPNTRVSVIERIYNWIHVNDPETGSARALWLKGAAGAGKSAIAQSVAEICFGEGTLVGSFFFGRSDPNRNHARALFPTIAYQMALALPPVQERIMSAIERDPLIFTRSLAAQFSSLIIGPTSELAETGFFQSNVYPNLIIVDGLDECLDRKMQLQILDVILDGLRYRNFPFLFLIASRPEHEISNRFGLSGVQEVVTRLTLDDSYLPDLDIELFLRDKFEAMKKTHPFRRSIPIQWPTASAIKALVQKSSGHFIYASTVIKYVESTRHQPTQRLEIIQELRPPNGDRPFAELDALYAHLLSNVSQLDLVLRIIAFEILRNDTLKEGTTGIAEILSLEPGSLDVLFCDLSSVISISEHPNLPEERIFQILHASLPDFLTDKMRSGAYFIDVGLERSVITRKCITFLATKAISGRGRPLAHQEALLFIVAHGRDNFNDDDVQTDYYSIHIPRWYESMNTGPESVSSSGTVYTLNYAMITDFLRFLDASESEGPKPLFSYHIQSFHHIVRQLLEPYYSDSRLTLLIGLIDFAMSGRTWFPAHELFDPEYLLFEVDVPLLQIDAKRLGLLSYHAIYDLENLLASQPDRWSFMSIIHRYLIGPTSPVSGPGGLSSTKYADIAACCLSYLSDDTVGALRKTNRHSVEYIRLMKEQGADPTETFDQPDGWQTRYFMAVEYFSYFLKRAAPSQALIEDCRRTTFFKLSAELPEAGLEAEAAVTEYLEWDDPDRFVIL